MSPEAFLAEQIPPIPEQVPAISPNVRASLLQLANCYLLLSMCSTAVLRSTGEKSVVRRFLFAFLLGDVGHVYLTYAAVGAEYFFNPSQWNFLAHGNITFTIFLSLTRGIYLLLSHGENTTPPAQPSLKAKSN
ncbi:hypothetical protein L873DRAFT_1676230 [Choiromyces venosus 120613-1]|uniref:DUF7704 domain-containing protein n=1 Tax=Choiromyces venosus 120613-1 TaxID=1336337 RepID=A0A3N4JW84_9PEZI|nr:hypothetical protein L873DRAFT_1676230 [Choiromyces venosus 120613-1]